MRPDFVRPFVKLAKKDGVTEIVLTDSDPNYSFGRRSTSAGHRGVAWRHGFTKRNIGAKFVVANEFGHMVLKNDRLGQVEIPKVYYDTANRKGYGIILTHFTGHQVYAFGGALKNLGMGLVGANTKGRIHHFKASIDADLCKSCYDCIDACTHDAIAAVSKKKGAPAQVNEADCRGCFSCLNSCNYGALSMKMGSAGNITTVKGRKQAGEYVTDSLIIAAQEATNVFEEGHLLYITDLTKMTVYCDCDSVMKGKLTRGHIAQYLGNDVGYLASTDPVALDNACINLIKRSISTDRWHELCGTQGFYFPNALTHQINAAVELGMGNKGYRLVQLDI